MVRGRSLRPSFYLDAAVPWVVALGVVTFRDEPRVLPALSIAISSAMAVDLLTGAAWEPSPRESRIAVSAPALPPPPAAPARDIDAEIVADPALASIAATLLLRQMARAADEADCNPVVAQAWLDESESVLRSGSVSPADSAAIDARVRREVDEATPELRTLCARSNPLLDSLVAIQPRAESGAATEPASVESAPTPAELCEAAAFGHCITFPYLSAELPPRSGPALDDVAARLRAIRLPVRVVIGGTADQEGDAGRNQRLGLARATAVRDALVRRGVPAEWLVVESCGAEPRCQLVPGATGETAGAELNRRVIFQLRIKESTP